MAGNRTDPSAAMADNETGPIEALSDNETGPSAATADNGAKRRKFPTRAGVSRKSKEEREQYARDAARIQEQKAATTPQMPKGSVPGRGHPNNRGRLSGPSTATTPIVRQNIGSVFGASAGPPPKLRAVKAANAAVVVSEDASQPIHQDSTKETSESTTKKKVDIPKAGDDSTVKSQKKKKGTATRAKASTSKKNDPIDLTSETQDQDDDKDEDDEYEGEDNCDEDEFFNDEGARDIETIEFSDEEEVVSTIEEREGGAEGSIRHVKAPRPLRAYNEDYRKAVEAFRVARRNRVQDSVAKDDTNLDGEDVAQRPTAKDDTIVESNHKIVPFSPGIGDSDGDKKTLKRKGARLKDATTITETAEAHAEHLRYNEEVRKLVDELESHKTTAETTQDRRLYLFQFPPLTPALVDPTEETELKQESEAELQPVASASGETTGATDSKEEGGADKKPKKDPSVLTADDVHLPSGLVGKLNVYKSGRMTLDWGGTSMEVRPGTEVDFPQDAVLIDETERTATALGKVEKKLICIPDWRKLFE